MTKILLIAAVFFLFTSFTNRTVTWVAIGDSITYLNDHQNETGNRVTSGYLTRVTKALPRFSYINQGHNGWTAGRIAGSIDDLGLIKADVYSVFLGTNDWWQGRPLGTLADYQQGTGNGTVYGSFRLIINKLRNLNPHAKILLITPMQRTDFVYINNPKNNAWGSYRDKNGQYLEQYAKAIDSIGRWHGAAVADLYNHKGMGIEKLVKFKRLKDPASGQYRNFQYPAYTSISFQPGEDDYPYPLEAIDVTYDGLHPSDKGYAMISDLLVTIMKKW